MNQRQLSPWFIIILKKLKKLTTCQIYNISFKNYINRLFLKKKNQSQIITCVIIIFLFVMVIVPVYNNNF